MDIIYGNSLKYPDNVRWDTLTGLVDLMSRKNEEFRVQAKNMFAMFVHLHVIRSIYIPSKLFILSSRRLSLSGCHHFHEGGAQGVFLIMGEHSIGGVSCVMFYLGAYFLNQLC